MPRTRKPKPAPGQEPEPQPAAVNGPPGEVLTLAEAAVQARAYRQALAADEQVARLRPDDAGAWKRLGVVATRTNLVSRGHEALRRAVALAPRDAEAQEELGDCDLYMGLLPEARQAFETYFKANSDDAEVEHLLYALKNETPPERASDRTITLGSAQLRVLPPPPNRDQNNSSVGLLVQYGEFRALLTGDSERPQAEALEEFPLARVQVPVGHLERGGHAVFFRRQGEHARPGLGG